VLGKRSLANGHQFATLKKSVDIGVRGRSVSIASGLEIDITALTCARSARACSGRRSIICDRGFDFIALGD
jgi:hypothetical protein